MAARAAERMGWGAMSVWARRVAIAIAMAACRHTSPQPAVPGVTVDAPCSEGRCSEGLSCRHEMAAAGASDRCVLEPGRCRDEFDCARPVQRCRRFGANLGVCQDSGL